MDLDRRLTDGLAKLGINKLTSIQEKSLEPAFSGHNIIGCSGTGTGKTFAYLLPVIMKNADEKSLYAVVLAPSKELCIQICSQINMISNNSGIPVTAAALFGGVNKKRQLETLKSKPNIVVGTYQRIYELIKEKRLPAYQVKTFIIDEADKILTYENMEGVMALRKCFYRDIQIMLYSASITDKTKRNAECLTNAEFVNIFTNEKMTIPSNIQHLYFVVERRERIEMTRKVINALKCSQAMVFSDSKYDTEEITQKLIYHNYNAKCIHADCDKNSRRQIIDGFRNKKINYLICSDIAARGLDFKDIDTIINIGLSDKPIDYLHRAGRCGRNGEDAVCASIITENELNKIKTIQKSFGINMLAKKLYQGKIVRK